MLAENYWIHRAEAAERERDEARAGLHHTHVPAKLRTALETICGHAHVGRGDLSVAALEKRLELVYETAHAAVAVPADDVEPPQQPVGREDIDEWQRVTSALEREVTAPPAETRACRIDDGGAPCGEPTLGELSVCYDHAKLGPNDEPIEPAPKAEADSYPGELEALRDAVDCLTNQRNDLERRLSTYERGGDLCRTNLVSSRMCKRGTKSCVVDHDTPPQAEGVREEWSQLRDRASDLLDTVRPLLDKQTTESFFAARDMTISLLRHTFDRGHEAGHTAGQAAGLEMAVAAIAKYYGVPGTMSGLDLEQQGPWFLHGTAIIDRIRALATTKGAKP